MKHSLNLVAASLAVAVGLGPVAVGFGDAHAAREVRNTTKTSVNRNTNQNVNRNVNANRNVNVNTNQNVNRNVNVNQRHSVDIDVDVDRGYNPLGVVAAVAVTAAVVGSATRTLPPTGCAAVSYGTMIYHQCGSTWYQPQYVGTTVQYVVVNPPR
jgi:hypothetical protein